jgi:hypothetical protein
MADSTSYPPTLCWHCQRMLDAASNMPGQGGEPHEGAISLCMYCGAVAIFGPEMSLYPPTKEELDQMEKDKQFMGMYMTFAWARQYMMIQQRLL